MPASRAAHNLGCAPCIRAGFCRRILAQCPAMHLAAALRRFARFWHLPISPHAIVAPRASPASGLQQELRSAKSVRFSDTAAANSLICTGCRIRQSLHFPACAGFSCRINDLARRRCKNLRHLAVPAVGCAPFWCIWRRSAASFTRQLARLAAWTRQLAALQAPGCAGSRLRGAARNLKGEQGVSSSMCSRSVHYLDYLAYLAYLD